MNFGTPLSIQNPYQATFNQNTLSKSVYETSNIHIHTETQDIHMCLCCAILAKYS
jgi:hypothetical protein